MRIFKCRWEVADERGKVEERYFRKRNANIFCRDMNIWSEDFFSGRKFSVRRIGG
jgi:hypothetical protein